MMTCMLEKTMTKPAVRRSILMFLISTLINVFALPACAQTAANQGWPPLEAGVGQKSSGQRLAAVRVLGLILDDPQRY